MLPCRSGLSRRIPLIALAVALPGLAAAQERVLLPAPDYFIAAVVASTTAQELARACPTLSLNPPKLQEMTSNLLLQLEDDGFDIGRPDAGMESSEERFVERQQMFLHTHGLDKNPSTEKVCAAGLSEIASESDIGALLVEVTE